MSNSEWSVSESRLECANCGYNLTGAMIGSVCPECGAAIEESLRRYGEEPGDRVAPNALPKISYVGPILVTVFCCLIGGIASLVYTANANTAMATGDVRAYEKAKKNRDGWIVASVIIGVIAVGIQIAIVVAES